MNEFTRKTTTNATTIDETDDFLGFIENLAEDKPSSLGGSSSSPTSTPMRGSAARSKISSSRTANETPHSDDNISGIGIKSPTNQKRPRRKMSNDGEYVGRLSIDAGISHVNQSKIKMISNRESVRNAKQSASGPTHNRIRRNSQPDNDIFTNHQEKKIDRKSESKNIKSKDKRGKKNNRTSKQDKESNGSDSSSEDGVRRSSTSTEQSLKLTRTLQNIQNAQDNIAVDSFALRVERHQAMDQCAILFSKAALTVVEGGACDFFAVRLSHPPSAPVMIEIVDKSGQIKTHPKLIVFDTGTIESGSVRHMTPEPSIHASTHHQSDFESIGTPKSGAHGNNEFPETHYASDRKSSNNTIDTTDTSTNKTDQGPFPEVGARQWDRTQLIRVTAIDDDAAEEGQESCVLDFKVRSKDTRYSGHRLHDTCSFDPASVKVCVIDNDGKYMYKFGDLFGPYGTASGLCREVHQFPVRVDSTKRRFGSLRDDNEQQHKMGKNARREPHVPHFATPRRGPNRRMKLLLARGISPFWKNPNSKPPVVPLPSSFRMAASGGHHIGLLESNGMVFFQGAGEHGQLGSGKAQSEQSLSPWRAVDGEGQLQAGIRAVACGYLHTAMITDDGKVLMSGSNQHGQLGLDKYASKAGVKGNKRKSRSARAKKYIRDRKMSQLSGIGGGSRASTHSVTSSNQMSLIAIKRHEDARLHTHATAPKPKELYETIPCIVKGLDRVRVVQVACGDNHTLVIAMTQGKHGDAPQVFGWGDGVFGALGSCSIAVQPSPKLIEELRDKEVFRVACGSLHSAVICGTGQLYTSGFGGRGRLGRPVGQNGQTQCFGEVNTHIRKSINAGYFGEGSGQVIESCESLAFTEVVCGGAHTGVLTDTLDLFVVGANEYGQLGLGDTEDRTVLTNVQFLDKRRPCSLSFGFFHSCAISLNGNLWVWGGNDQGQLGLGPNVLAQHLPRLQDKIMGLEVVQVHAGRGFTVVMTQLSVEHLMLLNFEDEDRFEAKKSELLQLRRDEMERLGAAKAELGLEHKRLEALRRHLISSNIPHPPSPHKPPGSSDKFAVRFRERAMQVIEVSARRQQQHRSRPTPPPPVAIDTHIENKSAEQTIVSPTSFHVRDAPKIPPMLLTGRSNMSASNGRGTIDPKHAELLADVKRVALKWSVGSGAAGLANALGKVQIGGVEAVLQWGEKNKNTGNRNMKRSPKETSKAKRKPLPYRSLLTGEKIHS